MKQSFILFIIILLSNCEIKKTENKYEKIITNKFEIISKYFKDTVFECLYVYPDSKFEEQKFYYKGSKLDSNAVNLLPESIRKSNTWKEGFNGVYAFKLEEGIIGLIARVPSTYDNSKIELWIYDLKKDSIINSIKLADIFGDAGDFESIKSYLHRDVNELKLLKVILNKYDHSVYDEKDTVVDQSLAFILSSIKYSSESIISKDSVELTNKYKKQIEILDRY
jgi:hypothetical protein